MKDNILISEDFNIKLDKNMVLNLMNCYPDSPIYEETADEYEEVKVEILKLATPKCIIAYDNIPQEYEVKGVVEANEKAFYTIITIGKEASELSSKYFEEGDYLKGMLADTIADTYIFNMEKDLKKLIKSECQKREIGIARRLEAPNNIPMDYQKIAYELTEANKYLGMEITSGFMLSPLKSNCIVYSTTTNTQAFSVDHDCKSCSNLDCKMRSITKVEVEVCNNRGETIDNIIVPKGENILLGLIKAGIHMNSPCAAKGTCGKCKIKILEGNIRESIEDRNFFTNEQLQEGYRLACKVYPEMDCKIEISQHFSSEFDIVMNTNNSYEGDDEVESNVIEIQREMGKGYSFAIDIGTTTIAIALINNKRNKVVDTYTSVNHQCYLGADVISRINASNEGKGEALRVFIVQDLELGMKELVSRYEIDKNDIYKVVISANTTMNHLLLGFNCETLGIAPFEPVDISLMEMKVEDIFDTIDLPEAIVTILPSISTFVGGDIVSGLLVNSNKREDCTLLVDLGTNGEIALSANGEILVTSTAMGPACEGGNITYGIGGISGAISEVNISADKKVEIKTIRGKKPIGICGTGALETVAELLRNGIVDETGLMQDEYFDEGFPLAENENQETIVFTQKDVREIQLAKAAVRAGVETLIKKANIDYDKIERVYLAGGFGFKLNKDKAIEIGLFAKELKNKIEPIGNSSLEGAIMYALSVNENEMKDTLQKIISTSKEISLGADKVFNELYVEHMMFEQ